MEDVVASMGGLKPPQPEEIGPGYRSRAELVEMTRAVLDLLRRGTTHLEPDVYLNPVAQYDDPARFEREKRLLFRETPQMVAFSSEIPQPGDFKTFEVPDAPMVIVRDDDGTLRAFLNVCRHRGAKVEGEIRGCDKTTFSCPFHGWTYDRRGRLLRMPGAEGFSPIDRSNYQLRELCVREDYGMIWVMATPGMSFDLDEHLHGMGREWASWQFEKWALHDSQTFAVDAPWKLCMDTYTETYHFPFIHPGLISQTSLTNTATYDAWGPHARSCFGEQELRKCLELPEDEWDPWRVHGVSAFYVMFPNTAFVIARGNAHVFQVQPGRSPRDSVTHYSMYRDYELVNDRVEKWADATAWFIPNTVQTQDYVAQLATVPGLHSGTQECFTFGRNEPVLHNLHRWYDKMVGD